MVSVANVNLAQHLEDADLVLEVGNSGQVKKMQHTYMQSSLHDAIASEPISKECDSSDSELDEKRETATKSVAAADEPTQQRYGDWSLYGYFFGAAGVRNIILWVASIILAALVERFPRESTIEFQSYLTPSANLVQQSMFAYGKMHSHIITSTTSAMQSLASLILCATCFAVCKIFLSAAEMTQN